MLDCCMTLTANAPLIRVCRFSVRFTFKRTQADATKCIISLLSDAVQSIIDESVISERGLIFFLEKKICL